MIKKVFYFLICGLMIIGLTTACGKNTKEEEEIVENNKKENEVNEVNEVIDNSSIVGTYKAKESGIYNGITINEDYSCYFLATSPDINYDSSCTYEYDGENITFNLTSGDEIKVTYSDDILLWQNYIDDYDLKFYKES